MNTQCSSGNCLTAQSGKRCATAASCSTCEVVDATGACVPATAGSDPKNECNANAANCTQANCDGAGTCHVPAGTLCGAVSCSGYTETGAICDANGTCTSSSESCPNDLTCSSSGTSCNTQCYGNSYCQSGFFCAFPSETCQAIGVLGASCDPNNYGQDCASGICNGSASGFICSSVRCNFCQQVDATGTSCSNAPAGTDPQNNCAADGCNDGTCNGSGACTATAAQGTTCKTQSCITGQLVTYACAGNGTCASSQNSCPNGLTCASSTTCNTSCTSDATCSNPTYFYCDTTSGGCLSKQYNGAPCTIDDACNSGHCAPGQNGKICAASETCPSCQVIDPSGTSCVNADGGTDPKNDCTANAATCEQDNCDGHGTCNAPIGTSCGAPGCSGSNEVLELCNASGGCQQVTEACPSSSTCAGSSCASACTTDANCESGTWCDTSSGLCVPSWPDGTVCASDDQCSGGHCLQGQNDKRCSALPSCPTCQVIDPTGTTCVNATKFTNPKNECMSNQANCKEPYCDGAGTCNSPVGQTCGSFACDASTGKRISPACDANGVCQPNEAYCPNHTECNFSGYEDCPPRCDARVGYYCQPGYTCIAYDECDQN